MIIATDSVTVCQPATGAISFVEREALAYDEEAVKANMKKKSETFGGCPGHRLQTFNRESSKNTAFAKDVKMPSHLGQWPCQIKTCACKRSVL